MKQDETGWVSSGLIANNDAQGSPLRVKQGITSILKILFILSKKTVHGSRLLLNAVIID